MLNRFSAIKPGSSVIFASGQTFEKSMVLSGLPVVLVGRTEVPPASADWLKSRKIRIGLAVQGEADIGAALQTIHEDYRVCVFALLGEGYVGDAAVKPAALMPLPGPDAIPRVDGLRYDALAHEFAVSVSNIGNAPLYVRAAVSLPGGQSGSSEQAQVQAGGQRTVRVPLDAGRLADGNFISRADLQLYSGPSTAASSVDALTYRQVPVERSSGWSGAYSSEPQSALWMGVVAIVLVMAVALLFQPGRWRSDAKPAKKRAGAAKMRAKR
ncbi:Uncharacterised protein [uncultured archaeon]|nr:Uncharacterised protein [uncultured archaeon]